MTAQSQAANASLQTTPEQPTATVVIPARNESRAIGAALESVLMQTEADLEVLVVDGDSDDGTATIVARHAARDSRVRLLRNPRRTIPAALNVALAEARAPFVVRVDAHSTIPHDYVQVAIELLRTGQWGGVGGRKDAIAETRTGRAIAAALGSRFGVGDSLYHFLTVPQESDHVPFGAYPVAVCRSLGGWDEGVLTNEDYEFDYRLRQAGHRLLLDPRLHIEWRCRESLAALAKQYWRYGRGKASVARKHPRSLRARHLAAPALVAIVGAAATVAPRHPRWSIALCTPYVVANAMASRKLTDVDKASRPLLPLTFATMHLAWGGGFWAGLLLDRRRQPTQQPEEMTTSIAVPLADRVSDGRA